MDMDRLRKRIIQAEGEVLRPYRDSLGILTIGIGHNLEAKGISRRISRLIFEEDLADTIAELERKVPIWSQLNEIRQEALVDLAFNMGVAGLLGFRKMWAALAARDYPEAARQLLDSKYATQVGERAKTNATMIEFGITVEV